MDLILVYKQYVYEYTFNEGHKKDGQHGRFYYRPEILVRFGLRRVSFSNGLHNSRSTVGTERE